MKFDLKGLDKLTKSLDKQVQKANDINKEIPLTDLFNDEFMSKYSKFKSFKEFSDTSPFDFTNLELINEKELDIFVKENSQFSNWNDMISQAYALWIKSQLK